jgi:hypothetical protein
MIPLRSIALIALSLFLQVPSAPGIILYRTGDPSQNTTLPVNDVAGVGWSYEGIFGGFLGTAIAPYYFITAQHFGNQGSIFTLGGTDYHIVANFPDPESDLIIYQVAEEMPVFAPLYSRQDEVDQRVVDIGRGTQRGAAYFLNATTQLGWLWGSGDGVERWGENVFAGTLFYGTNWDLLYATFDQPGLTNECTLSSGDSGGGAFINDGGVCKLAGINYGVDGPYSEQSDGSSPFTAALYDTRGLYAYDSSGWTQVTGTAPAPTAFYPTRISTKLAWICSVIAAPVIGHESHFVTLTYTRLSIPEVSYVVEQSDDLQTWSTANTIDETVSTSGSSAVIKAKIDVTTKSRLFLRLRTVQPSQQQAQRSAHRFPSIKKLP